MGTCEADMAQAVNRIKELQGGIVVCAGNKILTELALPIGGLFCLDPMETVSRRLDNIQQVANNLGCVLPDIFGTLLFLTSGAIPFLGICEQELIDLRQNRVVDLIVD